MKKRFTSFLAALLCLAGTSVWATDHAISTPAELLAFATAVNGGATTDNATLTANIDMDGQGWAAITATYTGTFDGAGYKISNLGAPLFAAGGGDIVIKNLTLEGTISHTGANHVGAFIGSQTGKFTVTGCVNKTNVTSTSESQICVGGFIGSATGCENSSFENCANEGVITGNYRVGGIVGGIFHTTTFTNCKNTANVTNTANVSNNYIAGGIIGRADTNGSFTLTNCTNTGDITVAQKESYTNQFCGGIVGLSVRSLTLSKCVNTGAVTADKCVGGMVGQINTNASTFTDCLNAGNIVQRNDANFDGQGSASIFKQCAGGLIGRVWQLTLTATNCANIGTVTDYNRGVKPNYGYYDSASGTKTPTATNCYATNETATLQSFTAITSEQVASGALCHLLNGSTQAGTHFYQNLDNGQPVDAYPVPDATHGPVYLNAAYYCDGVTDKGSVAYGNTEEVSVDPHTFAAGEPVCTVCQQKVNPDYTVTLTDGAYQIGTANDLLWFSAYVKDNASANGKLTSNIDMAGKTWKSMKGFTGTFDGAGFTISNLGSPLCATGGANIVLKDLTLEGSFTQESDNNIGAFIGSQTGMFTITDCVNKTSITATSSSYVGGFLGIVNTGGTGSSFENCTNEGAINAKEQAAGFVGRLCSSTTFTNCKNTANISCLTDASLRAGGIIAWATADGSYTLTNCTNTGDITVQNSTYNSNQQCGGIVACSVGQLTLEKCLNTGTITAEKCLGGMVGQVNNVTDKPHSFIDCLNTGHIIQPRTIDFASHTQPYKDRVGSMIGVLWQSYGVIVANCCNLGTVTIGGEDTAKPYAAHFNQGSRTVTNCYDINGDLQSFTAITSEQVASGALCYNLNGDQSEIVWYQTIGTDTYPVFATSSEQVLYVGAAGYTTFYDASKGWELNGDATANIGTLNGDYLHLEPITDIPAGTAVVIKGSYYNKVSKATPTATTSSNVLLGSDGTVTGGEGIYALAKMGEDVGFYPVGSEVTIPEGKAYLDISGSSVKAFLFDNLTGIGHVQEFNGSKAQDVIFDLSGRRVEKAVKGLYIVNGKKVLR